MRSIKAIVAGSLFIVVALLILQLAYIFIAVAYNALAEDYPLLNDITVYFRYIVGIPAFIVVMFSGGYITAGTTNVNDNIKVVLHCIAVSLLTVGGMLYSALENSSLTTTGIVVMVLALSATIAGGLYWQSGNINNNA